MRWATSRPWRNARKSAPPNRRNPRNRSAATTKVDRSVRCPAWSLGWPGAVPQKQLRAERPSARFTSAVLMRQREIVEHRLEEARGLAAGCGAVVESQRQRNYPMRFEAAHDRRHLMATLAGGNDRDAGQ